jgi:hypothetical protein
LVIVAVSLLVAFGASPVFGEFLWGALFWDHPFYINPLITLTFLIYVGLGLALTSGTGDSGIPVYYVLVGLWVLLATLEYSLISWFEIQQGILTSARRVNILAFAGCIIAIGATALLHMNQLHRRLHNELKNRGVEEQELQVLEPFAESGSRMIVVRLVGLALGATLVLWFADLIIGRTRIGLDVLGILIAVIIMAGLLLYSYTVLRKGPLADNQSDPPTEAARMTGPPKDPQRHPPHRGPQRRG